MEAQSFGVALSYGGPYCGVIAAKEKYLRQMPGRLVGETEDKDGRRGFVLTLSTREQHIRREKATSNICTNQALVALMATIFLTVYGKEGIRELALHNLAKAQYAAQALSAQSERSCSSTTRRASTSLCCRPTSRRSHQRAPARREDHRRPAAERWYPELGNASLWCATELNTREQIDQRRLAAQHAPTAAAHAGLRIGNAMEYRASDRHAETGNRRSTATASKVTAHLTQNEALIFEKSSPGKKAYKLPPLDVPEVDAAKLARRRRARRICGCCPS